MPRRSLLFQPQLGRLSGTPSNQSSVKLLGVGERAYMVSFARKQPAMLRVDSNTHLASAVHITPVTPEYLQAVPYSMKP